MTLRAIRSLASAAALGALLLATPQPTRAQAGLGAWDFEHPKPGSSGLAGNQILGANAAGDGVANPLGFKESTPVVTAAPDAPVNPQIEYAKGYADIGLGDYAGAATAFRRVLSVQPKNYKAMFMLGVAYNSAGDTRRAANVWGDAVKLEPQQLDARREYAVALARMGETEAARAQYAVIKARADACHATCAEASVLSSSLARIQSALSVFVKS